jgi:plasmid replication initiation protein
VEWAIKDDRQSMEHPIFSLSKSPDRKIRRYEHNGNTVVIAPGAYGLATIWDKDILIYAVSQLVAAMNADRKDLSPAIRLTAHDLLVCTNRQLPFRARFRNPDHHGHSDRWWYAGFRPDFPIAYGSMNADRMFPW